MSKATLKQAKKFMADLTSMMEGIIVENEDNKVPDEEKSLCRNLLLKLSLKTKLFTREQRDRAKVMLHRLEGDRRRRCRTEKDDGTSSRGRYGYAAEDDIPEVDEVKNVKLMIRKSKIKKKRGHVGVGRPKKS